MTEYARHWRSPDLPGVDLLRARYVRKTFVRHTHETYVIAAVTSGVDAFQHRGTVERAGPGSLALINPDTVHTGQAGVPEGWTYGSLYPSTGLVGEVAAELTTLRGTVGFTDVVAEDPEAVRLVFQVLRASEQGDPLAADTILRVVIARLLRRYGGPRPSRQPSAAGGRQTAEARAILERRMTRPPTLEQLAAELGTGPFALLRAFRERYGMPPHAWLTNARIHRARQLLATGSPPATVALTVGFTDQAHLSRHFTRIVGVPPGAYQRGHHRRPA
jgi:AraC-like DNA-binding protein